MLDWLVFDSLSQNYSRKIVFMPYLGNFLDMINIFMMHK